MLQPVHVNTHTHTPAQKHTLSLSLSHWGSHQNPFRKLTSDAISNHAAWELGSQDPVPKKQSRIYYKADEF